MTQGLKLQTIYQQLVTKFKKRMENGKMILSSGYRQRGASVRFNNNDGSKSKEYAYLTTIDGLKKGDLVVVEARGWYQVATFERYADVDSLSTGMEIKNIVQKIDIEELEAEKEKAQKEEELRYAINRRIEIVQERKKLLELASEDTALSELVKELEALEKE